MRGYLAGSLTVVLGLFLAGARAEEFAWRPKHTPPPADDAPLVTLGRPVALESSSPSHVEPDLRRSSFDAPAPADPPPIVRAQRPDAPAPVFPAPSAPAPVAPALPGGSEAYNCAVPGQNPSAGGSFWDRCKRLFSFEGAFDCGPGHRRFQSDHDFDNFISPVTNPFFFEDPRALTEVRPLFIYQSIPSRNPVTGSGNIEYLGLQARLAITERFSLVMTKFGETWLDTKTGPTSGSHSGFSEVIAGAKYTFVRCDGSGSIVAAGLNFDIPAGSHAVFQNTGDLSLEPYISAAQRIARTSIGTFNSMGTIGYNFATDNQRSDFLFTSLHVDLDIGNLKKIYPLIELNWFHYTGNGRAQNLNFEGRDLFNFGSQHVAGHDEVSLALGARYKINECIQFGAAVEFPLTNNRDLMDFRVMVDMIFRY